MPDRMVRDGWKTSRKVGDVTEGAELLLLRLLLSACNLSRYHADPQIIKSTAFPNRPRLRTTDIASRLDELEKAGLIVRYTAPDGTPLLEIPNFGQSLKYGLKSPFAPRPGAPPDAPGQTLLGIEPPADNFSAPPPEKRREEKTPLSPPPAGGGETLTRSDRTGAAARKPRRFRSPLRAVEEITRLNAEIARIREEMRDLYYPGGCATKVIPTGEKAARADRLRARWEAAERQIQELEVLASQTPENTGVPAEVEA